MSLYLVELTAAPIEILKKKNILEIDTKAGKKRRRQKIKKLYENYGHQQFSGSKKTIEVKFHSP